jgi:predicted acylesterase/phospholipase RssA/CRP-like cAMP-binding protein
MIRRTNSMEALPGSALDALYSAGLEQALRESPLFAAGLDEEVLHALREEVEPVAVRSGQTVVREGDASDSLFVVISGRLRVVRRGPDGDEEVLTELGRGDTVGEMGLIVGEPRAATAYAIRDSLLGRLSEASFRRLLNRYPQAIMERFAGSIIRLLRLQLDGQSRSRGFTGSIALVAGEPGFPLDEFADRLARHIGEHGRTLRLSSGTVDSALGHLGAAQTLSGGSANSRMVLWLGEQELKHRYLLFQTDPSPSAWSARCIRQADRIVVLGRAGADPQPGPLERSLVGSSTRQPVSLVLLREAGAAPPAGTEEWLRPRSVNALYHVREGNDADYARLARLISGTGVGLVFAGGGARAVVGLGVMRALREAGVPIDAVAGTSAGALLAGLIAMGHEYPEIIEQFRRANTRVDYTLPLHALTSGRNWSEALRGVLGDARIEDQPIGFFSTSVNLTDPRLVIHDRGSLLHAVRASSALPGVLPPVWDEGDILVDGGLVNNLPVDIMRERPGIGRVAGVEIGAGGSKRKAERFGYEVSGWRALWSRAIGARRSGVPPMMGLLLRSMIVSDSLSLRERRNVADRIFRPPVRGFSLLDWSRAPDAAEAGYRYACEKLEAEPPVELLPGRR